MSEGERRLAAVMYTDIVGYTALAQKDESSTLQALERHRSLLRPIFTSHGGREIKTIGDAFLVEFQSALNAILCAVAVQQTMHDRKVATGETISLRIGIHVGDVVEKGNDILGDAVNIASRIEPLAEAGGICMTSHVYEQVRNKSDLPFVSLGEKSLKNVSTPVEVYRVEMPWEKPASRETASYPTNRIAILPFTSFSPDPSDAFFADGITDEIISAAAGISGLKVISRTSVVGYKGTTKKVREIGKELEVGSILEGTFKKAGNRIRVTTQLISVADDEHLWAQNYDRNLDDVFEVQSDVAKQVAEALRVRILTTEKECVERKPTESTAAYVLYLKGRSLWSTRRLDDIKKAMEYFELATQEDPGFALGYVGQADCAIVLRSNWNIDPEENLAKCREMAEKALQLDPALAEAHASLGIIYKWEFDLHQSEDEFKKAIESRPSYTTAHYWYSQNLLEELRWDEALREIEKAVELDPLSAIVISNLGTYYFARRDYATAAEKHRAALGMGNEDAHGYLLYDYGYMRMYDEMNKEGEAFARHLQSVAPHARISVESSCAYFKGDKETVKRLQPELEAYMNEAGISRTSIADNYFFLGDLDKGFEWLERAYSAKDTGLLDITWDRDLDGVRTDPRYLDLMKRLGLDQTVERSKELSAASAHLT